MRTVTTHTAFATPPLADRFVEAWHDLGARLARGHETLLAVRTDPSDTDRLNAKADGVVDALSTYARLAARGDLDAAGLWRSFSEAIRRNYVEAKRAGLDAYATGLALAIEYQRGYGLAVDAAPLHLVVPGPRAR